MESSFDIVEKELVKELENISNLNIHLSKIQKEKKDVEKFGTVGHKSNQDQQPIDKDMHDKICNLLQECTDSIEHIKDLCQQPRTENQITSQDTDKRTGDGKQSKGLILEIWETLRKLLSKMRNLEEIVHKEIKKKFIDEKYGHGKAINKKAKNVIALIDEILNEISDVREKIDDLSKPTASDPTGSADSLPRMTEEETKPKELSTETT